MAVWGAPVAHGDDVDAAVLAALRMFDVMAQFNAEAAVPVMLGVGINTGPVIAGSVGSARRTEYTCVGDTVNVASRLCSMATGGELLLGESTAAALGLPSAVKAMAPVRVKGRSQPVTVHAVKPELRGLLLARRGGSARAPTSQQG
jgi:adenylate cyclase